MTGIFSRLFTGFILIIFASMSGVSALDKPNYSEVCTRAYDCAFFDPDSTARESCTTGTVSDEAMIGKTNAEKVYNWLVGHDIPAMGAAGVVGNLMQESGGKTENLNPKADNGSHRGLAQWDYSGRWAKLVKHSEGKELELQKQTEFIWFEFTGEEDGKPDKNDKDSKGGYNTAYRKIKTAKTPEDAAEAFEADYEISGGSELASRKSMAKSIYVKYGGGVLSGDTTVSCGGEGGDAFVDGEYAWPVDEKKSEVDVANWSHHDGSPALDITTKKSATANTASDKDVVGRSVFAISSGKILTVKDNYQGNKGCFSIMFESDAGVKGGAKWQYWHGHVWKPTVRPGQKVSVGEKIAEVGERRCTGNGSYPHLHLDRGSPQGSGGGLECCRDPGFITLMKNIYGKMPE